MWISGDNAFYAVRRRENKAVLCVQDATFCAMQQTQEEHCIVLFLSPLVWGMHVLVLSKHLQNLCLSYLKILAGREGKVIYWKTVSFDIGSMTFRMGNKYICSFFKQYNALLYVPWISFYS